MTLGEVHTLRAYATDGRIDVHRCDEDGGEIRHQLQRAPGRGGSGSAPAAVLGYAHDGDGSACAKADAALWSRAGDLCDEVVALHAERDALTTSVLDCYALATGNPDADPADALKASGAVLESISRLHASRDDLIDELGAVADALDVAPGAKVADTAIAVVGERDRYRRTLARLRPMVAEFERGVDDLAAERNRWRDTAEKQARLLAREVTPQDAVEFFTAAVLDEAAGAPNHAEWRGSYRGRQWTVTVQWADGQTPAQLIDAAVVEKDALAHAVRRERTAKANCRKANDALEAHAERYPFGQRTPWSEDRRRALAEACSAAGREQDAAIRALKALLGEEVSDG